MSEFIIDAEHEVGRNEVAIRLITGDTLVGTMEIVSVNILKLNVGAGQPYLIDSTKVLWIRLNK